MQLDQSNNAVHEPSEVVSRYLEAMCMVWVLHGAISGGWSHAFKMLHK